MQQLQRRAPRSFPLPEEEKMPSSVYLLVQKKTLLKINPDLNKYIIMGDEAQSKEI
jgi:hypothetical protein